MTSGNDTVDKIPGDAEVGVANGHIPDGEEGVTGTNKQEAEPETPADKEVDLYALPDLPDDDTKWEGSTSS